MSASPERNDLVLYLRLLSYVKVYWHGFCVAIIAMVVLAFITPAIAALFKYITAGVFIQQETELVRLIILPVLVLFAVASIASYVSEFAMFWVANRVIMDLRIAMFERLLMLPCARLDAVNPGTLTAKFTFDVLQLKEAATTALTTAVKDTLSIVGLLAWMLYLDPAMTLVVILAGPFISMVLMIIRKRLRKMGREVQESMGDIHHILDESISAHRIIKIYGGQPQALKRFTRQANKNRLQNMKFSIAAAASSPVIQIITAFALAAIITLAAASAASGEMQVDEFNSFFAALLMILSPIKRLSRINEHIQRGLAACESVFGFIDQPAEKDEPKIRPVEVGGHLQCRGLGFRYADSKAPVLEDISITIKPGMTVALVGHSGSGKSTLVNLLPRLYDYATGEILLDGSDIRSLPLRQLRSAIAYVSQDIILFNDTVRNNIAYGATADATEAMIIKAAEKANALPFIQALPQGFDTLVGNRGARLSGGQQQRIALARAFLKDAPLLILDEATSALDTESECLIRKAMEAIKKDRTCLIVAHRLSTIESADHIFVLADGRLVDQGRHSDLISRGGVYARLHQSIHEKQNATSA